MAEQYKICGMFKKVLFDKGDGAFQITSCKIINQLDKMAPIKLNKYGSISILSNDIKIELDKYYEMNIEYLSKSKYPNSYVLIDIKESEFWKLNYIIKFLQSTNFPGIGEAKGRKIVEKYGFDTLNIIANDEKITAADLGIKQETFEIARTFLRNNPKVVEDQLFFLKLKLSPSFYEKINKNFADLSQFLEKYQNNFYNYYFDEDNVSLSDLEKLTNHFFKEEHFFKKAIYIYKAIEDYFFNYGHTKVLINEFYSYYFKNVEKLTPFDFKEALKYLIRDNRILLFNNKEYLTTSKIREMEEYIVSRLKKISNFSSDEFEKFNNSKLHKLQNEAINVALNSNLSLITGSPGTGKTLIINKLIKLLLSKYSSEDVVIVTPTGRATININKQSEIKASTIHSFLQWNIDKNIFEVNEKWPERIKVLIIDEFSMVSVDLFNSLLKGLSQKTLQKIILVGDKNQLPAIGAGYLIKDFIEGNICEVIELTKIYRQADNFEIIKDAIDINNLCMPEFKGKSSRFIECDKNHLIDALIKEIKKLLKQGFTKKDIAILSPIYNYQTGIDNLNEKLSQFWHQIEPTESAYIGKKKFYINDKVINLVNDTSKKVFNGEIGYINRFIYDDKNNLIEVSVLFEDDSKIVVYSKSDFIQKTMLAYCTSVHKYQGSECLVVLTVLFDEAKMLLSKKLIYTAITRAQKLSIIFGENEALKTGILNDYDSNRQTCIVELWNAYDKEG